ncbi:MAG TPA: ATP-binding protein, partial [Opitutaceae bacterium]|nr:ATP-binding protein [Opitutaceae bacterium]
RFLYNERYSEIIQDKHPAALGATCAEIFPEIWPALKPLFDQTMQGQSVLIEDQELTLTRHGIARPSFFSFSYNPIANEDGRIAGFLAVVVETTARVAREQERAQVFDNVLSAITDFAYTFDRDGRFLYVNKALLDLWGLPLSQAVGKNFFDLKYPDELAAQLQRQIQQVITDSRPVRDETRYVSPTGVEGFYEYIFTPVFGSDGTVSVVAGSTRDITSRKKLEIEAMAASRAKDDFLATLSHELRTPLNPVLLLATEASENAKLPAEVRADFRTIAENVTMEARLIDDLLDISRITHDKLPLNFRSLDVHSVISSATELLGADFAKKRLSLMKRLDAPSSVVLADDVRLLQVFSNLLRNAIKFTPSGGQVTITTAPRPSAPGRLLIDISDTGIGMDPDELAKVFKPFAQGNHAADGAAGFGGLGLGLVIARSITELHKGAISVRSAGRNRGTTFEVELPLAEQQVAELPAQPGTDKPTEAQRGAGLRVLLVEDHDESRHVLARLLVSRKIDVVQAASVAGALAKAKTNTFDLVISDLGLPDGNGFDLMATLKADYGYSGIALSGYGTKEDIDRSKEAGFSVHLTKPVQARQLSEALDRFAKG